MSKKEPKTDFSPKANLGQNDARQQKLSSIQVRHMQGDKAAELATRQKSKSGGKKPGERHAN
jgi:hypothetical protein